jgi:hypothetical protein
VRTKWKTNKSTPVLKIVAIPPKGRLLLSPGDRAASLLPRGISHSCQLSTSSLPSTSKMPVKQISGRVILTHAKVRDRLDQKQTATDH